MKTIFLMALVILLTGQWASAEHSNDTTVNAFNRQHFVEMVGRKIKDLWAKFGGEQDNSSFIGRCFGVARKLKFVMPMIIFKLGVIVTVLAFLTLFSLKSLALLGLLLLINVSGAISKISTAFAGKHDTNTWKPPQMVHFHVHQGKDGNYLVDHSHTGYGWDDRMVQSGSEEDLSSLESYNLYNKLKSNPHLLRSYRDVNS